MFTNYSDEDLKLENRMRPLTEAYFGRTKEVETYIKLIDSFRKKYLVNKNDDYMNYYDIDVHNDPNKAKLEKFICDWFGFGTCSIMMQNTSIANMFTYSMSGRLDTIPTRNLIVSTSKGYRYKKEADYALIIMCPTGLFFNGDYTSEEIAATMLHEIGHNFSASQDFSFMILSKIYTSINLAIMFCFIGYLSPITAIPIVYSWLFAASNATGKAMSYFYKKAFEFLPVRVVNLIVSASNDIKYNISNFTNDIEWIFNTIEKYKVIFGGLGNDLANMSVNKIFDLVTGLGFSDERFADSFATMYGLGPELISAMEKLTVEEKDNSYRTKAINTCPFLKNWLNLVTIPYTFIRYALDPHPEFVTRVRIALDKLEADANDNAVSPKMRSRLKSDIKKLRDKLDQYEKYSITFNKVCSDPAAVTKAYQSILYKVFGGNIRYHIFTRSSGREINDRFKDRLKLK